MMNPSEQRRAHRAQAVEFERYALALLRAQAEAEAATLLVGNELPRAFAFADAFAPGGILGLPAPTFVVIKVALRERLAQVLKSARAAQENASLLIVTRETASQRVSRNVRWEKLFPGAEVRIIGREDLSRLADLHPAAALPFEGANLERAVSSLREKEPDAHVTENSLNALRSAYNDDRLALFVGAGVSRSAGLPEWPELVRRIAAAVFDSHAGEPLTDAERSEVHSFFESEIPASPLIVARLLRSSLKAKFAEEVRSALYDGYNPSRSPLLRELGALCMPRRDRVGITAVVTYNFDDLVESELGERGIDHRSVFTEGDKPLRSQLAVYHVHGFLPRRGHLSAAHRESLVLSEDAYHTQFVDPFVWQNVTQLNLLRSNVCLFVGMSVTDPNQRRLLEITASKDASVRHYAILKNHWSTPSSRTLSSNAQELTKVFKGLEEASLATLGVSVIWVDEFADVPRVLREIRQ